MTIRVRIEPNFINDGIDIRMARSVNGGGLWILSRGGLETLFHDTAIAVTVTDDAPFARIPDDAGIALRDALIVHYGGAPETQWLRADYDAERKRVDTLTAAILDRLRSPL